MSLFLYEGYVVEPAGRQTDFAFLLLALAMTVIGLFLVHSTSKALIMVAATTGGRMKVYSTMAAEILCWVWAVLAPTLWSLRYEHLVARVPLPLSTAVWYYPREFVGGVLIAGLIPNMVALCQSLYVLTLRSMSLNSKQTPEQTLETPTKKFSALTAGLSVLAVASNIATLIGFFSARL